MKKIIFFILILISLFLVGLTIYAQKDWCYNFKNNLGINKKNSKEDVKNLHIALKKEGFKIKPNEIWYSKFKKSTKKTVEDFQKKYNIEQTGFVGPKTRKKLNELYGCQEKLQQNQTQKSENNQGQINLGKIREEEIKINITSPEKDQIFKVGENLEIKWESKNIDENIPINIYLIDENTGLKLKIIETKNTGIAVWKIEKQIEYPISYLEINTSTLITLNTSKNYKIEIAALINEQWKSFSSENFTLLFNKKLNLLEPNGPDIRLKIGDKLKIKWISDKPVLLEIFFYKNDGSGKQIIFSQTISGNEFEWQVPGSLKNELNTEIADCDKNKNLCKALALFIRIEVENFQDISNYPVIIYDPEKIFILISKFIENNVLNFSSIFSEKTGICQYEINCGNLKEENLPFVFSKRIELNCSRGDYQIKVSCYKDNLNYHQIENFKLEK